jgi:hypothetical protein
MSLPKTLKATAQTLAKKALYQLTDRYYHPRYYFVGLTATGNRTAGKAMSLLGYSWMHYPVSIPDLWRSQVATDTPVAMWFRQGKLPTKGVYILTTRSLEPWLADCEAWFDSKPIEKLKPFEKENRYALLNGLTFDRDRFTQAYAEHHRACHAMAKQMGVTLHEWDVVENPTWDFLVTLTGRIPTDAFPYQAGVYNKTWQAVNAAEKLQGSMFI